MNKVICRTLLLGLSLGSPMLITPAFGQVERFYYPASATTATWVQDPHAPVAPNPARLTNSLIHQEKLANDFQNRLDTVYSLVTTAKNPEEELLGTSLQPVSDLQRAQLDIAAGQGLIVGGVEPNSAAGRVGLRANDILLTLSDKPLAKFEDLVEVLKTSREGNVLTLSLLRKGKKETIEVKPISVVTLGPVPKVEKSYMIGVAVSPVDEVLNDQFDGKLEGLIATEVLTGKPAEKAGLKAGDILVSIDGQPLTSTEQLTGKIKASEGKPVSVRYRRRDQFTEIKVTPEPRETPVTDVNRSVRLYQLAVQDPPELFVQNYRHTLQPLNAVEAFNAAKAAAPDSRVEALEAEVKGLKKQLEEIQALIKAQGKK